MMRLQSLQETMEPSKNFKKEKKNNNTFESLEECLVSGEYSVGMGQLFLPSLTIYATIFSRQWVNEKM